MNLKIIGVVNYREIKDLIKKIHHEPKIERRGGYLKKVNYYIYTSCDGKYSLAFRYKGDFHWGSTFYNLTLETRNNNKVILKKDFGDRIFVRDSYENSYPWAEFSNKFYLLEIEDRSKNNSLNLIKVYDADNNTETVVTENGWNILAWSKKATHIMYMIFHKNNTVDLAITDLSNKKTVNISKESGYSLDSAFFDKDEKHIIAVEENKQDSKVILLKIFTLLDTNLLYSQKIDLSLALPKRRFCGILLKKDNPFRDDSSWFTVKFDKINNNLYFGYPKKGSLWGPDYYERLLWFKAELEL